MQLVKEIQIYVLLVVMESTVTETRVVICDKVNILI